MKFTDAEELVIKYMGANPVQRSYVILGIGLINWLADAAFGWYFKDPTGVEISVQSFRVTTDEPRFQRNSQKMIASNLIIALVSAYREQMGVNPSADQVKDWTARANALREEYLTRYPLPEPVD